MPSPPRISIRGGRVLASLPQSGQRYDDGYTASIERLPVVDLHVADGRILAAGAAPDGFEPELVLDAAGRVVAPGILDLAARLREPGFEYKATLESEMRAAVAGGIVGLAGPPDTDPPLDEPGLIEMLEHRTHRVGRARLYPVGALTVGLAGEKITEMAQLAEAGCVGFSQALAPIADTQILLRAMEYAHTYDFTVWLHPQDPHLARGGVAHAGLQASRLGLAGVPVIAETIALNTIFDLVRETGCRVHLCRLSSQAGVELLRRARAEGLPLTCDVAVHHLHLADTDIGHFDSNCRVDPPFRSVDDRDALRAAVADGTIDAICSDHTPVDDDAKQLPFGESEPGVSALELLLPLALSWARERNLPIETAWARLCSGPAQVLGLGAGYAALQNGAVADVCVFDPGERWLVSSRTLLSQSTHTPFIDHEVEGRVHATLVGGRLVHCSAGTSGTAEAHRDPPGRG